MHPSSTSSSARLLAPLALVASLAAVLAVVTLSLGDDLTSGGDSSQAAADRTTTSTDTTPQRRNQRRRRYVIQPGDTLAGIAEKTGVPLETIEELNPKIDPLELIAGQRIKLRE